MMDKKRIKQLLRAEAKLHALEARGVDNWDWYEESLKEYYNTVQLEEDVESLVEDLSVILLHGAHEPSERGAGYATTQECLDEAVGVILHFIKDRDNDTD